MPPAPSQPPEERTTLGDLLDIFEPGFFTLPGCASVFGIFMAFIGIALGVLYAVNRYEEGLLLVIIIMLAALLVVVATKS